MHVRSGCSRQSQLFVIATATKRELPILGLGSDLGEVPSLLARLISSLLCVQLALALPAFAQVASMAPAHAPTASAPGIVAGSSSSTASTAPIAKAPLALDFSSTQQTM